MTFSNPWLLWALPAALAPLVIHFLMRWWHKDVVWGAQYVLARALARFRRRVQWLRWLRIGLRVAALALLAVLFAGPRPAEQAAEHVGRHRIVIVDGSYSMEAETSLDGSIIQTRWDRMRVGLSSLLDTWPEGDTWSLYFLGGESGWVLRDQPVSDRSGALEAIDALRVGNHRAQLARGLSEVAEACDGTRTVLYLFVDDQAISWEGVEDAAARLPEGMPRYWVNPPVASRHNLAVTQVRLSHQRILRGHPCSVFAAVRNFGTQPVKHLEVSVMADGAFRSRETVSLIPGQEEWVHGEVTFDAAGSHYVTARLPRDVLASDNVMAAGIDVMDALRVAVLRDPQVERFQSAWSFLSEAGAVFGKGSRRGRVELELVTDEVVEPRLSGADVVLLDAGRTLDQRTTDALRRFVRNGGGLVLAAGPNVDAARWNELLGASDLLPAPLTRQNVRDFASGDFVNLQRTDFESEGLRSFEKVDDGDLAEGRFYSWHEVGELAPDTRILARFTDGAPFALLRRFKMGRTLLLTAGLEGNGNNLPVREFFFPLITELFTEAACGAVHPRTVRTGRPIRCLAPNPRSLRRTSFVEEGAAPAELRVERNEGRSEAVLVEGARMPGVCSVVFETDFGLRRTWFGAQGPRVDSDLTPLRPERVQDLSERLRMKPVAGIEEMQRLETAAIQRDYVPLVCLVLLLVCLAELLLARWSV